MYNTHGMNVTFHTNRSAVQRICIEDIKSEFIADLALKPHHVSSQRSEQKAKEITSLMIEVGLTQLVISQIKILLAASHDTTSASVVHTSNLLCKHPSMLALVQWEHTPVFGHNIMALPNPPIIRSTYSQ